MSKILNIISQIISLAKGAKKQVLNGNYASTKRILRIIASLEESELKYIKDESGSDEFYRECLSIYKETSDALHNLEQGNNNDAIKILDRIILLEKMQIRTIAAAKKGLDQFIIETVDPYIRELIVEINKLSFVKGTLFSCSGHFSDENHQKPYITLEYDWESRTKHNITLFHRKLLSIVQKSGIVKPIAGGKRNEGRLIRLYHSLLGIRKVNYYLGFSVIVPYKRSQEEYKEQFIKQWNQIFRIVKEFQDNDSLEYKKERKYIKENPDVLGEPEKAVVRGIFVRCPQCQSYMITHEMVPTCKTCKYRIGEIINPNR